MRIVEWEEWRPAGFVVAFLFVVFLCARTIDDGEWIQRVNWRLRLQVRSRADVGRGEEKDRQTDSQRQARRRDQCYVTTGKGREGGRRRRTA